MQTMVANTEHEHDNYPTTWLQQLIEKLYTYVISRNCDTRLLFVTSTLTMGHLGRWMNS